MKTDPKDFRIGNYIKDVGDNGEVSKIVSISTQMIDTDKMTIYPAGFELDHGISLTSEWLERFGWDEHKSSDEYLNYVTSNDCGFSIEAIRGVEPFTIIVFGPIDYPELKYVHQLQNLFFSLTGAELTIKGEGLAIEATTK